MIFDSDIEHVNNRIGFEYRGHPVAWVIGNEVVYAAEISKDYIHLFFNHEVFDVSTETQDPDTLDILFKKDGQDIEVLHTSEYFGSVLLSDPKVINLFYHKNGRYVEPNLCTFENNEFQILHRNVTVLPGYTGFYSPEVLGNMQGLDPTHFPPSPFEKCEEFYCDCEKL